MNKVLLLLALLLTSVSYAQPYYNGQLVFANGKKVAGWIKPPAGYHTASISYKASETSEKVAYKSTELKSVIIYGEGENFQFDWGTSMDFRMFKLRESAPQWMILVIKGPATLYTVGEKMRIKEGRLTIKNSGSIPYYAVREGEKSATSLGFYMPATAGLDANFRTQSAKYFADYPALVKRIENEEFSIKDVELVVAEYNKWKAGTLAKKSPAKNISKGK